MEISAETEIDTHHAIAANRVTLRYSQASRRHTSLVVVKSGVRDCECRRDLNLAEDYAIGSNAKLELTAAQYPGLQDAVPR
jgi:hypothetical protein